MLQVSQGFTPSARPHRQSFSMLMANGLSALSFLLEGVHRGGLGLSLGLALGFLEARRLFF